MAIRNLRINFLTSGADKAKLDVDSVSAKVDKFGNKSVSAKVGVDDGAVSPKLTAIQAKLDALTKRKNELQVTANSAKAQYDLARMGQSLDKLSRMTANPNISVRGVESAEVKLLGLEAMMDKLGSNAGNSFGSNFASGIKKFGGRGGLWSNVFAAGVTALPALAAVAGVAAGAALGLAFTAAVVLLDPKVAAAAKSLGSSLGKNFVTGTRASGYDAALIKDFSYLKTTLAGPIESIANTLGKVFLPALRPVTSGLVSFADWLSIKLPSALNTAKIWLEKIPWAQVGKYIAIIGKDIGEIAVPAFKGWEGVMGPVIAVLGKLLVPVLNFIAANPKLVMGLAAMAAAFKVATLAVAALNAVFEINPIVLAVTAIAVSAYLIIKYWKPISKFFSDLWSNVKNIFDDAWLNLKLVSLEGLKAIVDGMTNFTGNILHLASAAFGWIPGLGGTLRNASKNFDDWKRSVDGSLQGMIDTTKQQIAAIGHAQASSNDWGNSLRVLTSTIGDTTSKMGLSKSTTDKLTSAMITNRGNVDTSKSSFEKFAAQLGISKSKADSLWSSLKSVAGNYAANVKVSVSGGGTVKVQGDVAVDTGTGISTSLKTGEKTFNGYSYAQGGLITMGTTPTADDVPIFVSRKETVVSAAHSKQLAPVFRAVGVPGYANGGLIGASVSGNAYPAAVSSLLGNYAEPKFATSVGSNISKETVTAIASALKTGIKEAIAAAKALEAASVAGITSAGASANGASIMRFLMGSGFAPIAAAGAVAGMYGESGLNPEAHEPASAGDGPFNGGLMGFTPLYNYMGHVSGSRSNVPDSVVTGNASSDFQHQLKAIIEYVDAFGMRGSVAQMNRSSNVLAAANIWGTQVERYGINDVHSAGIALATSLLDSVQGGNLSVNKKTGISTSQISGEQTFSGYSYDHGGLIPEAVRGYGLRSGKDYMFHANEWVTPSGRHISNGPGGGGDVYITVQGDTDPDGAALRIQQKLRAYKKRHGNAPLGLD